jgi:hypothetical protein
MSIHHTQARVGLVRPRLYTLIEMSEELRVSPQTLRNLVGKYKIEPPFKPLKGAKKQYKLSDFQEAMNKDKHTRFKIDKGIPLPPRKTAVESKFQSLFDSMEPGDSTLMSEEDTVSFYQCAKRKYPERKYASRKVQDEFGMKRVWRLE